MNRLFTSESVSEGHPDKVADQISDAVLDAMLSQDPKSRVACETLVTTGLVVVAGEVTSDAVVDFESLVRGVVKDIGYTDASYGFDYKSCEGDGAIRPAIARYFPRRDSGEGLHTEQGAGDQGMMFGYACRETPELMPLPITLSHNLVSELAQIRKDKGLSYLRPDGKAQVTVAYDGDEPRRVHTVVVSTQHDENISHDQIVRDSQKQSDPRGGALASLGWGDNLSRQPNRQICGGRATRRLRVDRAKNYRGYVRGQWGVTAGARFRAKTRAKWIASAHYAARWVAKNIVAAGLASRCEVQLAYAIGVAKPVRLPSTRLARANRRNQKSQR